MTETKVPVDTTTITVRNPADGTVVGEVPIESAEAVARGDAR